MRALLDLLAPRRCLACAAPAPPPWCDACTRRTELLRLVDACGRCGGAGGDGHRAGGRGCWPTGSPILRSRAVFDYTGPVADAIVAAKRVDAPPVWPALARHLAALLRAVPGPTSPDVVTWVPSRSDAVRARGVDHARVLGRAAGAALGLPALPLLAAAPGRPDQAARTGPVRRQVRPDDLVPVVPVAGARVLLVDDVLTTGATLGLAAWVLRRAGAASVEASVLARAGAHTLGFRWAAPPTSPLPGAHR